jgi:hypothetical protein
MPGLLDLFVTAGFSSPYADIRSSYDLSSDYTPIIATISTTIITTKRAPRLQISRTNWHKYKLEISGLLTADCKLKTPTDIDDAITTFTNSLKLAALLATPTGAHLAPSKASPDGRRTASPSTFIPSHIKKLVALKGMRDLNGKQTTPQTAAENSTKQAIH